MRYLFLDLTQHFEVPEGLNAFRCVILIEREVGASDRNEICEKLVDAGCLYAMAWGIDCSIWDDCIDQTNIFQFFPDPIPADRFVMTTWHNDETLEDVFFFAKFLSGRGYNGQELKELLVLDLGLENREAEIRSIYDHCDDG